MESAEAIERVFAVDADQTIPLTCISATSSEGLLSMVRAVLGTETICASPDDAASSDGAWDEDEWTALVSVLVVDGVSAIDTAYPRLARRIFDMHAAIRAADEAVVGS